MAGPGRSRRPYPPSDPQADTPAMPEPVVFLDNNATTPIAPSVLEAMLPFFGEHFGNAASAHALGREPARAVQRARRQLAELIGASDPAEVVFTSGGTEASNLAVFGAARREAARKKLIVGAAEHPATLAPAQHLAELGGHETVVTRVDHHGQLDLEALEAATDERTALVSLLWVNNETGAQIPDETIERIAARTREVGALFHLDAVQAAAKVPLEAHRRGIDLLSISAHKFHGPKGIGALWIRDGVELPAQTLGGSQERALRPGTQNVPGIVGLGAAAELASTTLSDARTHADMVRRRDEFEAGLLEFCPDRVVHASEGLRVPTTSNTAFPGLAADGLMMLLSELGVCASTGAACSSTARRTSPILGAMGIPEELAACSLRFSFARTTTDAEIEQALGRVGTAVRQLRAVGV